MKTLLLVLHFLLASLCCFVIASLMHTQMVLAELSALDIQIELNDRIYMSLHDIIGLMPSYGVVVTIGLAIALGSCQLIKKVYALSSNILYPLAGASALMAILLAMQPIMDLSLLAGARSYTGFGLQVLAGAIGGLCFARLRKIQNK